MAADPIAEQTALEILENIQNNGDQAMRDYARMFDKVEDPSFQFFATPSEIQAATEKAARETPQELAAFRQAARNIRAFHERQVEKNWSYHQDGAVMGMQYRPVQRAGVYVPGGKAFYPSSVLMNVIPALVAGVPEIILATPPASDGTIKNALSVALASELGVTRILKAGGAQAIAALAYGTETVPSVAKITGPGNRFVAAAKKLVSGIVGIDSIAGPSEVAVFADDSANPDWCAIDLCSQAEHDGENTTVLITTSADFAARLEQSLDKIVPTLARRDLVKKSLDEKAVLILVKDYAEGFDVINRLAPEHVEIQLHLDSQKILSQIHNAGAIFIGKYTPVACGDYYAGPNHVIPTNGTAVFSSPLGVHDFMKRSSFLMLSKDYLQTHGANISRMARAEELEAHALSVEYRMKKDKI